MNERTSVFPSVKRFLSHQCPSRCMKECSLLCRAPCLAQNKHVIYNSHHPHPARVRAISPPPICGPCSLLNPSISPFLSLSFSPSYVLNTFDHFLCLVHTLHPQSSAQQPFPSHIPPPPSHRELPGVSEASSGCPHGPHCLWCWFHGALGPHTLPCCLTLRAKSRGLMWFLSPWLRLETPRTLLHSVSVDHTSPSQHSPALTVQHR